jgi:hypothetical protein
MIISNHHSILAAYSFIILLYMGQTFGNLYYLNELSDFVKADSNNNFLAVPDFEPTIFASLTFGMLVEIYSRPY